MTKLNYAAAVATTAPPASAAPLASAAPPQEQVLTTSKTEEITQPSLCIPRLSSSFNDGQVIQIIEDQLKLGKVKNIDFVQKVDRKGDEYHMAFIHFISWNKEEDIQSMRTSLVDGEKLKIVYDEPQYFTLVKSYTSKNGKKENKRIGSNEKERSQKQRTNRKAIEVTDNDGETWNVIPSTKSNKQRNKQSSSDVERDDDDSSTTSKTTRRKPHNGFNGLLVYSQ